MQIKILPASILTALLFCLAGCQPDAEKFIEGFVAEQEVTIKSVYTTPGNRSGDPPPPPPFESRNFSTYYYAEEALRIDTQQDNKSTIYRFDQGKVYSLDHDEKVYSFRDIPVAKPLKESELMFIVQQTGQPSKVGVYPCALFRIHYRKPRQMIQEICMSDQLKIDWDIYQDMVEKMANVYPESAALIRNLLNYGIGFPVQIKTEHETTGAKNTETTRLLRAEASRIPYSKFTAPNGYAHRN